MSTVTRRPSSFMSMVGTGGVGWWTAWPVAAGLEADRLDLAEHVVDAAPDLFALGAEHGQLGAGALGFGRPGAHQLDLAAQLRVLLVGAGDLRANPDQLFVRPRAVRARPVEHRDEHLELLLEPVDGFDVDRLRRDCRFCHEYLAPDPRPGLRHRRTAPCLAPNASTMRVIASSTSASVSVRSGERNVRRNERLTRPSGTPLPRYRSNSIACASSAGAAERIVPRTAAAGKALSTSTERSRTTDGNRGSDSVRRSAPDCNSASASTSSSNAHSSSAGGKPRASRIAGAIWPTTPSGRG